MTGFNLKADFTPQGSQPGAIASLVASISEGKRFQTLMGVTGSGKTFTVANVIAQTQKPTLVLAHNKTLAAQLYNEFKDFFPENRVEYFVSYYDFYQPESYIPQKDQYIEKDAQINPKIEQLRLAATASLLSHDDVIVVASVSAIYGLGNPENFEGLGFEVTQGGHINRSDVISRLIDIQYERNDIELQPGRFRVKGDTIDLIPGSGIDIIRIEFFGNEVERITEMDRVTREPIQTLPYYFVYPARHYVIPEEEKAEAIVAIKKELEETLPTLGLIEAHRLRQRTLYDIEMIEETGYCKGIENYSRFFDHRRVGEKPFCLLDYFPDDFMIVIDESHQTLPQVRGMYNGDYSRKKSLVDYGFRLPSAFDNRPLKFEEFENYLKSVIFVSATPGQYETEHSGDVIEQIIRPTGLLDPEVTIRPGKTQIPDVCEEIEKTIEAGDRVLITTLTKKLAEELSEFLAEKGIKTRYLHSEINTIERTEILRELRLGVFDVLVGINLLREGLDIPEVSFIGILDADKEGFLRDARSLIQTIGRAARNDHSHVVLYADTITDSIKKAVEETNRRREMQIEYNRVHGITPITIHKPIREKEVEIQDTKHIPRTELPNMIIQVETEMLEAAERLDFERAIVLREKLKKLNEEVQKP